MKHMKNYLSILSMFVTLMLLMFTSCAGEEDKNDGIINNGGETTCLVSVKYGEGGTATTSDTQVMSGWEVTLTATPEKTYRFVNWTLGGKEVSRENPYKAVITKSAQYQANFEKDNYKVSVKESEGGSVKASQKGDVLNGTKVTFTATPQDYYSFVNWTVNGVEVSKENPYTATITEDMEIKANSRETYKPTGTENGIGYVDLGLSVKWATCNVGADTPEEYGDIFAWGETTPKTTYNWSTYKYCNGSWNTMTKYCTDSYYGTVDNKTTLELSDDAAYVNWGGSWRMPTLAEQKELLNTSNCTWTWTTQNGVKGYEVRSRDNGNSIFLPVAGYRIGDDLVDAGSYGYYWSSSLRPSDGSSAYYVYFLSSYVDWYDSGRCIGRSVRAVCE